MQWDVQHNYTNSHIRCIQNTVPRRKKLSLNSFMDIEFTSNKFKMIELYFDSTPLNLPQGFLEVHIHTTRLALEGQVQPP